MVKHLRTVYTDDDSLSDTEEIQETHTDPQSETTYQITEDHEDLLEDLVDTTSASNYDAITPASVSFDNLAEEGLNDATDDFDFVLVDDPDDSAFDRMTFTAMDGSTRTDL